MNRSVKAVISTTASLLLGTSLFAGVVTIDFENFVDPSGNTVDLQDNNRITDQYQTAYGLTFSGTRFYRENNTNKRASDGDSKYYGLSIYDASGPVNNNDNDLELPYDNVADFGNRFVNGFDNVLVVQENSSTNVGGADDNARGGIIKMRWDEAVSLTELIFLDIGDNGENNFGLNFKFYYANGDTDTQNNVFGAGGDSITLFEPTTASWLDAKGKFITGLDVKYKASSALASLSFSPIPEPSQLLFIGTALSLMIVGTRRRRKAAKQEQV